MRNVYGAASDAVYDRLQKADPALNQFIQDFVYDHIWSDDDLSLRDRSLATVAALVGQNRPEQLRIHITGFFNCGGTRRELRALIVHLAIYVGFPAALAAFEVANEFDSPAERTDSTESSSDDK